MTAQEPPTDGAAKRDRKTFRLSYEVKIRIGAPPERIWAALTDAAGFPRWNSTVESVEGEIGEGKTIKLRAKVAPSRVFKLKVSDVVPNKSMVWSDGMPPMFKGVRTYSLTPLPDGATEFAMVEVFRGLMLPMIAGSLPDFAPIFERYAADLKREAEAVKVGS